MQNENMHSLVGIEDCFLNSLYKIQLKLSLCIFIFDCLKTFLRILFSCILYHRTDLMSWPLDSRWSLTLGSGDYGNAL